MRLSWQEVRARAGAFSEKWEHAHYEKGETQSFYDAFFYVFGVNRRKVAQYEMAVQRVGRGKGFVDLFWPRTLIVEQKSKGRDLFKAEGQAVEYLADIADYEQPRYILVSDFQTFKLTDLETRESIAFALPDLHKHVEKFGFMMGVQRREFKDQDPANIKAAELVGSLHDEIKATGYEGHKLERFLVRIVFCMFADDTGIFQPKDSLLDFLEHRTNPDGTDTGPLLGKIFEVLDTPEDKRSAHLDEDLAQLPYVNGELFSENLRLPDFNASMRAALLNACRFDWTPISPAIFGSLFQSVMDAQQRREMGAHYTTEKNIMKVIEPLFMDDLRAEFDKIKSLKRDKRKRLEAFQAKLSKLTFFDPACGCGNFLIIAYRELRLLELEIMREIKALGELALLTSAIDVDQFYGIEYEEFPARIAETALWMMDHIMNNRLSLEFGEVFARIPLKKAPTIVHGDALETDWEEVLPAKRCSFVLGNPPFIGHVFRTKEQKYWFDQILQTHGIKSKRVDYVFAWFLKAASYVLDSNTRVGFVATNSISQGEQVALVWPRILSELGMTIQFAYQSFIWGSEARGKASVHVVIVGFAGAKSEIRQKVLYLVGDDGQDHNMIAVKHISPYLIDTSDLENPDTVIARATKPLNGLSEMRKGTEVVDGGHYILDDAEKAALLAVCPEAESIIAPFWGGREYLNGIERWLVNVHDAPIAMLKDLKPVRDLMNRVRTYRENGGGTAKKLADDPRSYHVYRIPKTPFLAFPAVSSERRAYAPIGYLEPPIIPSDQLRIVMEVGLNEFAILTSGMHMAWLRNVGGKMKSDYRYSAGLVYNTFPLPKGDLSKLAPLAEAVLAARAAHEGATLADLYDPDLMPANLRKAHQALDRAVDKLYRRGGFESDRERVEHLFSLYEQMVKPLLAGKPKRKRRAKAT
jgi:MmeI, DNA-methyltransferase domain/MmeI, target recognition domain/MmeI, N-terminal domain/MmeI, C-terminal domain/MmeI, helicase spacer domain